MTDRVNANITSRRSRRFLAAERIRDIFARRVLFIGRDAVFDVEHDRVGVEAERFVDHLLSMSGHEHP